MSKVVVHGVHRSGTSFWASLLEKSGCWYAEDTYRMPPQKDNPRGFWERVDIVELNDKILSSLGMTWFSLNAGPNIGGFVDLPQYYKDEIHRIATRFDKHDSWFIKDPRLSITWPLWSEYFKPSYHLVVHRHPISVAKSLNRRNGISMQHGLIFWYHQTRMIARSLVSEDNVINVQFNANAKDDEHWISVVEEIFKDNAKANKLKSSDIHSLYESKLINHHNTSEQNLDKDAAEVYKLVSKAWEFVTNDDLESLLELPEFEVGHFSWDDLDTKYAIFIQNQNSERESRQYQNEIERHSKRIIELSDDFAEERKSLNLHINSLDKELEVKGEQIRKEQREVQSKEKGIQLKNEQIKSKNKEIHLLKEKSLKLKLNLEKQYLNELKSKDEKIKSQQETIDELNRSLLNIAGILNGYMNSKRYFVFNGLNKMMSKLKILKHRTLHDALDMAKFGHSPQDLERVIPSESSQTLFLKAVVRNPLQFIRKFNVKRFKKGLKVIFGNGEADMEIQQALFRYHAVGDEPNAELDILHPEHSDSWFDPNITFVSEIKPKISIVIPVYNNYWTTLACLHSIKKHTNSEVTPYEIILADDCSTDETRDIESNISGLVVVRPDENLGFLKNCNNAMRAAKGEFIALLNNDTNVQSGWLAELLTPLVADSNVGVTGPMFIYPDGRLQEAGGIVFEDASGWNYGRFDDYEKPEYNFSREVDYVSGACLVFRKSLWEQIGGFDERYTPAYYEDTDFCFVVRSRGLQVRYIPMAKVIHFEGVSHGSSEESGIKKYQITNKENFFDKWKDVLASDHCAGPEDLFKARYQGRHKKTLLFIDHYVPFYDKDAGSKVAQRYVELLVEQGVHVIFLGDNFYPHQPYTLELQKLGVEVLFGEYYKNNWFKWLQENSPKIDAIYLNRPHISEQYIDKILSLNHIPYLAYHGADLHYVRVGREESLGIKDDEGRSSSQWKEVEYDLMRKCDISLWLSQQEVDLVRKEDPAINVDYKPMYWFEKSEIASDVSVMKDKNILFVGGFGHPPNLDGLNWFLEQIYPSIVTKHPQVRLTVIGSNCPDEVKELACENVEILGFVSEAELVDAYTNARLTIVPLRYGAGVKGKVIESMQYGVPVLTTSVGAEGLPGDPSDYLTVADKPIEFTDALLQLLEKDDSCESKVFKSNEALIDYFSKQSAIQAMAKILGIDTSKRELQS